MRRIFAGCWASNGNAGASTPNPRPARSFRRVITQPPSPAGLYPFNFSSYILFDDGVALKFIAKDGKACTALLCITMQGERRFAAWIRN